MFYSTAQPALVEYTENVAYFNPAAIANQSNDSLKITSFYIKQWVGVNGNPKHVIGFVEYNLSKINSGIGLSFCNERIGLNTTLELGLSYRYSLKFKNERVLSAGMSLDYYQLRLKCTFITPTSSFYVNSSVGLSTWFRHTFEVMTRFEIKKKTNTRGVN